MFLLGGGAPPVDIGDVIGHSMRLRSSASAYLTRTTGATPTNNKIWTVSCWFKRGILTSGYNTLFSAGSSTNNFSFRFNITTDTIEIFFPNSGATIDLVTTQSLRDISGHMHFVLAIDTTQGTAANRAKLYINGVQVTSFSTATYPTLNASVFWNDNTLPHYIGQFSGGGSFGDGVISNFVHVDGQALAPTSFGRFSAQTGSWVNKNYTGTYGNFGSKLTFSSVSIASDFGTDSSGNGNTWTVTNVSIAAGATYDWLLDTPTNNHCVLDIGDVSRGTVTDGNLSWAFNSTGDLCRGTMAHTTGKLYFEAVVTAHPGGSGSLAVGILGVPMAATYPFSIATVPAQMWLFRDDGQLINNGAGSASGVTWTTGDIVSVAYDIAAGKIWWAKNGTWVGGGNPALGTSASYTNVTGSPAYKLCVNVQTANANAFALNAGQRPFSYTPPGGFTALNTINLPKPVIPKASAMMDISLRTGTGAAYSVTGKSFAPGLAIIKGVSGGTTDFGVYDTTRGVQKDLAWNQGAAETTQAQSVTAFNTDGYSGGTLAKINTNTSGYVDYLFKKGSDAGVDSVIYTGNATNRTIAHALGVAPAFILVKRRDSSNDWIMYHRDADPSPATGYMTWINASAFTVSSAMWNNTAPTGSVFSLGTDSNVNANTGTFVAHLFAEKAGFMSCGSYTGNGSTDGPSINCGFRPAFVLIKDASILNNPTLYDAKNSPYNMLPNYLVPISTANLLSTSTTFGIDLLATGFKVRTSGSTINTNGDRYVYVAFAEMPFKYANAR